MSRRSGSMSGRWKRSRACGSEPRRGNPETRTYRRLNHRATSRLYCFPTHSWNSKRSGHLTATRTSFRWALTTEWTW